ISGRNLVLYDYRSGPKGEVFYNLEAFDDDGHRLWTAENPSSGPPAAYVEFMSHDPLQVWDFACLVCTIDPETGKLLDVEFRK
ncbi:MAG: hypothetical protein JXR94_02640, partial [Candidatus Hydrogenedentes bacterium]|nr:hypothetical protein [Candidatus Hydrogenedentota bacterium]